MPRVLIVTGSYCPAVLADTHRARLLAPELVELGWEVEVLAAGIDLQRRDSIETDSDHFFSASVPCHFAQPFCNILFRLAKMRSIGWRALWPLYRKGAELIRAKRFDLIYITTAQFNLFCLGRAWKWKYGVLYVLDFHDPWVHRTRHVTTKHWIKFYISAFLAKSLERFAVTGAVGVVAVSPNYIEQLRARYPKAKCLQPERAVVIPFGASQNDLSGVVSPTPTGGSTLDVVYTGAGGVIMEKSWCAILQALRSIARESPHVLDGIRFKFYGTDAFWEDGTPKFLVSLAEEAGMAHLAEEHPRRISYACSLDLIKSSRGLLVLGVDDPAYMPSKLFTYALTNKPLLACLHVDSQVAQYFRRIPTLGYLMQFDADSDSCCRSNAVTLKCFLSAVRSGASMDRTQVISDYLSPAAAARHASLFQRCIDE